MIKKRNLLFVIVSVLLVIISLPTINVKKENLSVIKKLNIEADIPDFSSYVDVKEKKKVFFDYFYPIIVNKNIEILNQRKSIKDSLEIKNEFVELCNYFKVECDENNYKNKLLMHINIIPPSLAMAQAANESAWGTSRFAKEGNNYYGIWCFSKGCGIIPKQRGTSENHEVKKFKSPNEGVSYYIDNLNRHNGYKKLRNIRINTLDSLELSNGLLKYSERGEHYVEEIQDMISFNKLKEYDNKMNLYLSDFY